MSYHVAKYVLLTPGCLALVPTAIGAPRRRQLGDPPYAFIRTKLEHVLEEEADAKMRFRRKLIAGRDGGGSCGRLLA